MRLRYIAPVDVVVSGNKGLIVAQTTIRKKSASGKTVTTVADGWLAKCRTSFGGVRFYKLLPDLNGLPKKIEQLDQKYAMDKYKKMLITRKNYVESCELSSRRAFLRIRNEAIGKPACLMDQEHDFEWGYWEDRSLRYGKYVLG